MTPVEPGTGPDVTRLLASIRDGDRGALDKLFELVYSELRRLASAQLRRVAPHATLSTTALVNEAYVRFAGAERLSAVDRQHFYSLAARAMRQILVDHARRRLAQRRGGGVDIVALADWDSATEVDLEQVVAIDERLARIVEWRVFGGLTLEEIAEAGELSVTTLKRDWRKARAFLQRELGSS